MAESFDPGSLIGEFRDEARDQVDRLDAGLIENISARIPGAERSVSLDRHPATVRSMAEAREG